MTKRPDQPSDGAPTGADSSPVASPAGAETSTTPDPDNDAPNPDNDAPDPDNHTPAQDHAVADPESASWTGPSAWVFPGLVAFFGAVAVWGAFTIEAPPNSAPPGPGVVPGVIGTLLLLTAARMAIVNLRVAALQRGRDPQPARPPADWPPVLIIVGTLAVHVALLETLGWLLAGALLFWGVAYAFGARAHLRDAVVSLSMSAAVQVGFSFGLGLNLPGGVLELVL